MSVAALVLRAPALRLRRLQARKCRRPSPVHLTALTQVTLSMCLLSWCKEVFVIGLHSLVTGLASALVASIWDQTDTVPAIHA